MLKPIQQIKEEFLNAPNGDYCESNGMFSLEKVADKMGSIIADDRENMFEMFTKKTMNKKNEPICPKCGKDMERDCQEPDGHLWFCPCMEGLRLSIG